jgi:hypothetical protein
MANSMEKNVYARFCASQGCTAVVIGQRAGVQEWIVWNHKDKYRQAVPAGSSPGDGVDNACRFRPTRCRPHPEGLRVQSWFDRWLRFGSLLHTAWLTLSCRPTGPHSGSCRLLLCARHDDRRHLRPVAAATLASRCCTPGHTTSNIPPRVHPMYFCRPDKAARNGLRVAEFIKNETNVV